MAHRQSPHAAADDDPLADLPTVFVDRYRKRSGGEPAIADFPEGDPAWASVSRRRVDLKRSGEPLAYRTEHRGT